MNTFISSDLGEGIFGRLIVITDKASEKIKDFRDDEYFADIKEAIKNNELKNTSDNQYIFQRTIQKKLVKTLESKSMR